MKRLNVSAIEEWSGQGVLSIFGPTGSGKTRLAIDWVQKKFPNNTRHALLVSLDAVSQFRDLDIGSAKPMDVERTEFDWAGIDLFAVDETPTVKAFLESVERDLVRALQSQRPVLLVGGSGFYERALVEGMGPGEASDPSFQKTLEGTPLPDLYRRLVKRDRRWLERVHGNDRYRVQRYLDLSERQGLSFETIFFTKLRHPVLETLWNETHTLILGLELEREDYAPRLRSRVDSMLSLGWVEEVKKLLARGFASSSPGLQSIGYKEVVEALMAKISWEELPELLVTRHLQLVKKQKTWIRGVLLPQF